MTTALATLATPLAGRMVLRRPTISELAERAPLVLTSRDRAVLHAVATHGFLTSELLALAFFPPASQGQPVPSSRAYLRLRQLWLSGFLNRLELPVTQDVSGSRPYLYALSRRGLAWLHAHGGLVEMTEWRGRTEHVHEDLLDHDMRAAALWAQLQALVRMRRLCRCDWVPERRLRARDLRVADPRNGQMLPVLPDGYVELEFLGGAVQCWMVEIDMGTLTLRRFRRKLRAFDLYVASGLFSQEWRRADCGYLTLVGSWKRLTHLWKAARRELPEAVWDRYLFATTEVLAPECFGASDAWLTAGGKYIGLVETPTSAAAVPPEVDGESAAATCTAPVRPDRDGDLGAAGRARG